MRVRVIGIGQPMAGDDGVGLAVVRHLRKLALPERVELMETADPSGLPPLLEDADLVVLVDAVAGAGRPGRVLHLTPAGLQADGPCGSSTHGLGVGWAIELARTLSPDRIPWRIDLVGISIERPRCLSEGLSAAVAAAVPRAAEEVACILEEAACPSALINAG